MIGLFGVVFFMSLIAAAWAFSYDETHIGVVTGRGKVLDVIQNIADFEINTSSGNLTNSQNLTLDSKKPDQSMDFIVEINKTLTEPLCPDYENDCSVIFGYTNGTEIITPKSLLLTNGLNFFSLETSCVPESCGQNITIRIFIS